MLMQKTDPGAAPGQIEELVKTSLDDDKAENIIAIDLTGKSAIADTMVIASGRSQRHVSAIADHLLRRLKSGGQKGVTVEGLEAGDWVLVDAGDVIVHIFRPEVRNFYNIEKMWMMDIETPESASSS